MSDSNQFDEVNEENDLFYFESDHLALRGNKDYSELLKTITILEAQRAAALHDIDKIIEIKNDAIKDPKAFIEKLKNNEDFGIPIPQDVAELPEINFSKYGVPISDEVLKSLNEEKSENSHVAFKEARKPKTKDVSITYNQPWSAEEQKKLEELLIKYPVEAIEMRRYKKIADALGNRTVKQVTSRVQKYFKKLYKAGLPVPGRIPKTTERKKTYSHRHQRNNYYLYKPSTFFPDMDIPVVMNEADDEDVQATPVDILDRRKTDRSSINYKLNKLELKESDELQFKIELLKRIKNEKLREKKTAEYAHKGFKCDICNEEPITGSRWHCFDCERDSVDFCTDCMISQVNAANCHPLTHNLIPLQNDARFNVDLVEKSRGKPSTSDGVGAEVEEKIEDMSSESEDNEEDDSNGEQMSDDENSSTSASTSTLYYDKDYVSKSFMNKEGKYNYLDPNFLPE